MIVAPDCFLMLLIAFSVFLSLILYVRVHIWKPALENKLCMGLQLKKVKRRRKESKKIRTDFECLLRACDH